MSLSPVAAVLIADIRDLQTPRVYRKGTKRREAVEARVLKLAAAIIGMGVR